MSQNFKANQYKQTSVLTASRGQILLMLYEAAIKHTKQAILAIEKKDLVAKGKSIGKVHDILNELITSLDFKVGGDIAKNLDSLYNFCIEKLIEANFKNTVEPMHAVLKLLETLHAGWKVAVSETQKQIK